MRIEAVRMMNALRQEGVKKANRVMSYRTLPGATSTYTRWYKRHSGPRRRGGRCGLLSWVSRWRYPWRR